MPQLKFRRKLGTAWVFQLTWKDRIGARQSIVGATGLKAFWRPLGSAAAPTVTDTGGITINETGDPNTYGDFTYKRTDLTPFVAGNTYWLDFEATINGDVVPVPEDGYVVVEVLD